MERRALALKHVETGRRIIARQRELIKRQIARGVDTATSESLLRAFERSQMIFEHDLADLDRRKPQEYDSTVLS